MPPRRPSGDGAGLPEIVRAVPAEIEIAGVLATAEVAVADGSTLEGLTRPLLEVLHKLTDMDSVYLTEIRPAHRDQVIRFSDNSDREGGVVLPENAVVDWEDSVCRRSLESGISSSTDVEHDLPGSGIARELGIRSYVGVPVVTPDNMLLGTLCAAGSSPVQITPTFVEVMGLLARLIADQWQRDRTGAAALQRAESAEEKLVERATFLAEAEHLLKSPLTVLRGWSEMLADEWVEMTPAKRSDALHTMRRASRDAAEQLEQLLEEARGQVLSHRLAPAPVQVEEIISDVVGQLQLAAGNAHRVSGHGPSARSADGVESEPDAGATVIVDRYALWQVLWHLGENAVKYSPDGGRIEYLLDRVGSDQLIIEVLDEGLGIPPDLDIFAAFVRGASDHSGITKGTGLGLHIVRTLVQAMGGTVSAAPRPGRGSVFRVVLPAAAEESVELVAG